MLLYVVKPLGIIFVFAYNHKNRKMYLCKIKGKLIEQKEWKVFEFAVKRMKGLKLTFVVFDKIFL